MNQSAKRRLSTFLSLALCAAAGLLCCAAAREGGWPGDVTATGSFLLLGFAVGGALLLVYVAEVFWDRPPAGGVSAALAMLLFLAGWLSDRTPSGGSSSWQPLEYLLCLSLPLSLFLLLFYLSCIGEKGGQVLWVLAIVHLCVSGVILLRIPLSLGELPVPLRALPGYTCLAGLAAALCLSWFRRRERFLFRCFFPLFLAGTVAVVLWQLLEGMPDDVASPFPVALSNHLLLTALAALSAAILADHLLWILERQREEATLRLRAEIVQAGYENLLVHNEEVRMIRHDMKKHFYALRQMADGRAPQIVHYLDDLIDADQAIRPVVHSGGPLLNAILNGSLNKAMNQGAAVKVLRDRAPSSLPMADKDLCSLVLNVMDNAVEACAAPGLTGPFLNVDLYTKGAFFFFSCENSRLADGPDSRPASDHIRGFGLAIVQRITEQNGGFLKIDESPDRFRVRIALPIGSGS